MNKLITIALLVVACFALWDCSTTVTLQFGDVIECHGPVFNLIVSY